MVIIFKHQNYEKYKYFIILPSNDHLSEKGKINNKLSINSLCSHARMRDTTVIKSSDKGRDQCEPEQYFSNIKILYSRSRRGPEILKYCISAFLTRYQVSPIPLVLLVLLAHGKIQTGLGEQGSFYRKSSTGTISLIFSRNNEIT